MRKSYKITLGVLTVMILLTLTIGTSYSYYSVGGMQEKDSVLATRCFKIVYEDGNGDSHISLPNAYPISDDKGMSQTPYKFSITNTCTAENESVNYKLILGRVSSSPLTEYTPEWYLLQSLNYNINSSSQSSLSAHYYNDSYGDFDFLSEANESVLGTAVNENVDASNSFILVNPENNGSDSFTGTLAPGETKNFQLRLWINENACSNNESCENIMGASFNGRLLVYAYV